MKTKRSTHPNSLAAHRSNRYGERCRAILEAVKRDGPGTDRDIMRRLNRVDPNSVRPRITTLVEVGALEQVGEVVDPETHKTVRVVDLPRSDLFRTVSHLVRADADIRQLTQPTLGI